MLEEKFNKNFADELKYYERSRDIYKILNNVDQFINLSDKVTSINFTLGNYDNFFMNKKNIYILSGADEKKGSVKRFFLFYIMTNSIKEKIQDSDYKKLIDFISKDVK